MQFSKAWSVILSVISVVSADFPTNIDAVKPKESFQRMGMKNMFQNLQTTGRRLDGHDGPGMFSANCTASCNTGPVLEALMSPDNAEALATGDVSFICDPELQTITDCASKADACIDPDEPNSYDNIKCMCKCPALMKMESMTQEEICKQNPYSCFMAEGACSNSKKSMLEAEKKTEAEFNEGIGIQCAMVEAKCEEKGMAMGNCSGDTMTKWEKLGCQTAVESSTLANHASDCCPHAEKLVECYSVECMALGIKMSIYEGANASEVGKQYQIGEVCPKTGVPKNGEEMKAVLTKTTSWAWVSHPHVVTFVVMVGSLFA